MIPNTTLGKTLVPVSLKLDVLRLVLTHARDTIRIQCAAAGIDLSYTAVGAGSTLEIDCGAQTIRIDGFSAYPGLVLNGGHSARGWLPLIPGEQIWTITSGAGASFQLRHYDQWL